MYTCHPLTIADVKAFDYCHMFLKETV